MSVEDRPCRVGDGLVEVVALDQNRVEAGDGSTLGPATSLQETFGLTLQQIVLPTLVVYNICSIGSIGGGWLSSGLIQRGWSVNSARKTAMLICAIGVVPVLYAPYSKSLWVVVALVGLATAAHQGWSANLFTTVSDMFPRAAVGSVVGIGGTLGAFWNRHFDCKIALEQVAPGMRPGMSSNIVITTGTLPNSLWVPSQALFESDSRTFVYLQTPSGFTPRDVKLVRRSESQVVLTGLQEGQMVALANPELEHQNAQTNAQAGGSAMKALSR